MPARPFDPVLLDVETVVRASGCGIKMAEQGQGKAAGCAPDVEHASVAGDAYQLVDELDDVDGGRQVLRLCVIAHVWRRDQRVGDGELLILSWFVHGTSCLSDLGVT